jgi:hypothetical protein
MGWPAADLLLFVKHMLQICDAESLLSSDQCQQKGATKGQDANSRPLHQHPA